MKTTIPGMILGSMMALSLAACNTTRMNSDGAMGSSSTAMTAVGDPARGDDNITARGAVPVNCATNVAADGTNAADNPGARCPTESH